MKAIFSGTLAAGFGIQAVVEDEVAAALVVTSLAKGILAEALTISSPLELNLHAEPPFEGTIYVVFGRGLGNSMEVYGPFRLETKAEEFGEKYRDSDSEWEIFIAPETCDEENNEPYGADPFGAAITQDGEVECTPEVVHHSSANQVDRDEALMSPR